MPTYLAGSELKRDTRMTAKEAGYMELRGAEKDGDCRKVRVTGGISKELGCCNEFKPESEDTSEFRCGTCRFEE